MSFPMSFFVCVGGVNVEYIVFLVLVSQSLSERCLREKMNYMIINVD